jgi:hypothetical protein
MFRQRLPALVANWMRFGYCQGNVNGDNCAVGGFSLDGVPSGEGLTATANPANTYYGDTLQSLFLSPVRPGR